MLLLCHRVCNSMIFFMLAKRAETDLQLVFPELDEYNLCETHALTLLIIC